MRKIKIISFLCILVFLCNSCGVIFLPRKQNVTVTTNHEETKVYMSNEEIGKGKVIKTKIRKKGSQQVIVQTPGYKDQYYVNLTNRRPIIFYPLAILDAPFLYPLMFDLIIPRGFNYKKTLKYPSTNPYINRKPEEKYIDLEAIRLDIKDKNKNIRYFNISEEEDIEKAMLKKETETFAQEKKQEEKAAKKKKAKTFLPEDKELKYDNTKFSENIYKTLKKTGYVDTVNKVFIDNNNTLQLLGSIRKVYFYTISSRNANYNKLKVEMMWYLKNTYGEVLDSITRVDYSGEYLYVYGDDAVPKMFADAVDVSYSNLSLDPKFKTHLLQVTNMKISDANLKIKKPTTLVNDVAEAADACVIVKRKDGGHGSGFAISNDGYIITNFHVVGGDILDKLSEVKVILSNGDELAAKVVRHNRMKDLALLKVDYTFPKAFLVKNAKEFKNLQQVYTMGAPKSIELGQTVSLGLISNERKINNNNLLQLSMAINHGNSGGPLFEKSGILHGVIQSKLVGFSTEGVGFAIPAYTISESLNISVE